MELFLYEIPSKDHLLFSDPRHIVIAGGNQRSYSKYLIHVSRLILCFLYITVSYSLPLLGYLDILTKLFV